ncbi:MAG: hypothetical protein WHT82_13825, partial [Limisphaera sp.]
MNKPMWIRGKGALHALAGLILTCWLGGSYGARALLPSEHASALPAKDLRRHAGIPPESRTQREAGLARMQRALPGVQVSYDSVVGSARFVRRTTGFLTQPPAGGPGPTAAALPAVDPETVVRGFLREHADAVGHGDGVLDQARRVRDTVSHHSGLRTVIWQQELAGIPIFEADLIANLTARGELVTLSSRMLAEPVAAAAAGSQNWALLPGQPPVRQSDALVRAAADVGVSLSVGEVTETGQVTEGGYRRYRVQGRIALARAVWFPMDGQTLRLAWE